MAGMHLVSGSSGSGKTTRLLERAASCYRSNPLAGSLVLVPTVRHGDQWRRRLVERCGAAFGLEVATTQQWARARLTRTSVPRSGVVASLLEHATREVLQTAEGAPFAPLAHAPGLRALVAATVHDLLADDVTPQAFRAAAGDDSRLRALAAIFAAFTADMDARGWVHPGALAATAADALGPDEAPPLVLVDGFRVFRRGEVKLLAALARHAEVIVAIDPAGERARADVEALRAAVPPEAWSEERLDASAPVPARFANSAPDREAALRAIAREVKQLLADHPELRPSDCAVVVRQVSPYLGLARQVFREYDLPLDPAAGVRLADRPLGVWLRRLLHLADGSELEEPAARRATAGWRLRDLVAVLSSAFVERGRWGLRRAHVASIARTGRRRHLWSGPAAMDALVEALRALAFNDAAEEDAPALPGFLRDQYREAADGLAEALSDLRALLGAPPAPLRVYARALDDALFGPRPLLAPGSRDLDGVGVEMDALRGELRSIAAADEALSGPPVPFSTFVLRLERELEAPAVLLREPGGVLLAPLHTLHGLRFAYLAVAGLVEGEFPARRTTSALLDADARATLAGAGLLLPPDPRASEDELWESAQTRADGTLSLWRSRLDERGRPAAASYYFDDAAPPLPAPAAASRREGAIEATRGWLAGVARRPARVPAWPVVRAAAAAEQRRRSTRGAGLFEGDLPPVRLERLTGAEVSWSATRLESYRTCGFAFFGRYALHLRELDEEIDVADAATRGSVIHEILDEAVRPLADARRALTLDTLDVALARLAETGAELWDRAPATYGFGRAGLWRLERDETLRQIEALLRTEAERADGVTRIDGTELWVDATLPAEGGPMRVGSRIDRLDVGPDLAVVVDYKSGRPVDRRAVQDGRYLQLQLYAHLARARTGADRVVARYAFLRGGEPWDLDTARPEDAALVADAVRVAAETREAIEAGRFRVQPADRCPFWCSFQHVCRKHESTRWKRWD